MAGHVFLRCPAFFLSGAIPSLLNAFFESVSGFTTTGASILNDIESLPRGILFWRSFTHWIGGMGVLVFVLSIVSLSGGYSFNIMRAESPGPSTNKFVPKIRDTAKILYGIYIALTLLEILFLALGGMSLYDSFVHAFGTAGTGGFSVKNASIGAYNNAYFEYVIGVFMVLFGVNFSAYFLILTKKLREFVRFEELRAYLIIIAAAVIMVTLSTYRSVYPTVLSAFRYSFFQVTSNHDDDGLHHGQLQRLAPVFQNASAGTHVRGRLRRIHRRRYQGFPSRSGLQDS
jgi:trk system potassium uptake protein TrkH